MAFQKQRAPIPCSFQCFLHSLHLSQLHNSLPSIVRIGWLGQKEPPASLVQIWLALSMRLASVFGENSAMYSASYAGTKDRKDRRMLNALYFASATNRLFRSGKAAMAAAREGPFQCKH